MRLETETHQDFLLVRPTQDRIDAAAAIQFKEAMRRLITDLASPARVLLDMSPVSFLDSSGLGALVAIMKLIGPDRRLELAGLTPPVARVFRLTRMDGVFTLHDTVPGAPSAQARASAG